jgi:uncharacterized protein YegL
MHKHHGEIPQPTVSQAWYQLGVLVIDGSASMTEMYGEDHEVTLAGGAARTKAEATDDATRKFVDRMRGGRNAPNFGLAVVYFNDNVTHERQPMKMLDLDPAASYNPTTYGTGGTAIHTGLDAAARIIERFRQEGAALEVPLSQVVVVMSDGEDNRDPAAAQAAANRIKALPETKLCSCLFATRGGGAPGEPLLQGMATGLQFYQRIYDTEALRKFFEASVTTVGRELVRPVE